MAKLPFIKCEIGKEDFKFYNNLYVFKKCLFFTAGFGKYKFLEDFILLLDSRQSSAAKKNRIFFDFEE